MKSRPVRIAWGGEDSRRAVDLLQIYLAAESQKRDCPVPVWITADPFARDLPEADVLLVNEWDLHRAHHKQEQICWKPINIIVAETYWQLEVYRDAIPAHQQLILILDTWMDDAVFQQHFGGWQVLDRFYFKFDCLLIAELLAKPVPAWYQCDRSLRSKPYSTFCLLGRQDHYRDQFVWKINRARPQRSLIRYRGRVIVNEAEDFDHRPYNKFNFFEPLGDPFVVGSFDLPRQLYEHYRFETVVETTQWQTGGWPFVEYNISEKTLKPMLLGVPAAILAPCGYHAWLATQLGIDVTGGVFDSAWDHEPDDNTRMILIIDAVQRLAQDLDQEPDPAVVARNREAMMRILDWNTREIQRCVRLMLEDL